MTCSSKSESCLTCSGNRVLPPFCKCPLGTWEESISIVCPSCHIKCTSCLVNEFQCQTCSSNRVSPPLCICPDGTYDNLIDI